MPTHIGRYLRHEAAYKADAYAVLKTHFRSKRAFDQFYAGVAEDQRNDFLRVCATYRYLAKHGDWKVKVRGVNPIVDYLTNSFKLVAVFSLIESLSDLDHVDFYQWLTAKSRRSSFPIVDRQALHNLYVQYKVEYGAVRRCVDFFSNLPLQEQQSLCGSITVKKKPTAQIEKLAEHLYKIRSEFVHKAEFAHELSGPIYVRTSGGLVHSELSVDAIFRAFELGVICHFRSRARLAADPSGPNSSN